MTNQNVINKLTTTIGTWQLFLVCALFITGLWLPRNWDFYGSGDWDLTYTTFEVARKSIVEFHQWPHYNPFLAFGSDLDANPQGNWMSVFFIPVLLFGSFYGYKISILMAILIGLFGMKKLLMSIGNDAFQSTQLSIFFCTASFFSSHIIDAGHSNFLYFYFFPYLLYFLNKFRLQHNKHLLIWPLIILFQMLSGGAPFVFIVACVMVFAWLIGLLIHKQISIKNTLLILSPIVFAIGLSLWKILPAIQSWKEFPRLVTDDSQINILVWLHALNDSKTDTSTPHEWHEITIGVGLILPILILAYRQHITHFKTWFIISCVIIWMSLGNQPNIINPWYIVHHFLPIFDGLRAPFRFGFITLFIVVLGSGIILKNLNDNKLVFWILIGISLSNTLSFNSVSRNMVFSKRLHDIHLENTKAFAIVNKGIHYQNHYESVKHNQFLISAYEPQHISEVKDTLSDFVKGATMVNFSPNKLTLKAKDSMVTVALRYSKYWTINENASIINSNGLIHFKSKDGKVYELEYSNPNFETGLKLSLLVLILSLLLLLPINKLFLKKTIAL